MINDDDDENRIINVRWFEFEFSFSFFLVRYITFQAYMVDIDMMMKRYRNRGRHKQTNKKIIRLWICDNENSSSNEKKIGIFVYLIGLVWIEFFFRCQCLECFGPIHTHSRNTIKYNQVWSSWLFLWYEPHVCVIWSSFLQKRKYHPKKNSFSFLFRLCIKFSKVWLDWQTCLYTEWVGEYILFIFTNTPCVYQ